MVIDSSAMLAILLAEPEQATFTEALAADGACSMSVASLVECSIVLDARYGPQAVRDLDLLLARAEVHLAPVDRDQADLARHAYRHFGKGRHAAALDFGDCFAYALAQSLGEPLLFKGGDFSRTDVLCHPASV
ncbi:MAG: type II toxin-antitoxin system VapC family toxin [Steroidobacteraceae bacterium]